MTNRDRSDSLSAALRELETPPASAGFTAGVLAQLDERDALHKRRRHIRIAVALQAAVVVLAVSALLLFRSAPPSIDANAARSEELRREYRQLQEELETLQRASDRSRTVLYLGANDEYDLVLDLNPLLDRRVGAPMVPVMQDLRVRPAQASEAERRQP